MTGISGFVCHGCGNCCRGEGFVRINTVEANRIADFLRIGIDEFYEQYTREPEIEEHAKRGERWLKDAPGPDRACIFLHDNLCVVHPVKPQKCIDFPLKWRTPDVMDYCEGMKA